MIDGSPYLAFRYSSKIASEGMASEEAQYYLRHLRHVDTGEIGTDSEIGVFLFWQLVNKKTIFNLPYAGMSHGVWWIDSTLCTAGSMPLSSHRELAQSWSRLEALACRLIPQNKHTRSGRKTTRVVSVCT